ncbi:FAD-binding oxidoreductase [Actinomycetospora termitidis]|uniref:FAD-dependent oxidoreductase n=1 Tax=Actinomycetospora termitidis TaxID=3053470 RepID=A0ABT7M5D2_9PSEU|nr:FAD-dependent oxidoreductase [Actinomycetospora sp. Odt1-22]MDL5155866.1 FAD-dependent oxidoreductase [Actinomycetospora sp. Odt1-22]
MTAASAVSSATTASPATRSASDPGYDAAVAAFNTAHRPCPALVVEARSPDDVVAAVRRARGEGLPIAVQATGHGLASDLAGSLLVSLRDLDAVRIDPERRVAVVGGGATWAQVIAAATPHGLAPICGSSSGVGVAGFLLGGGHGPLSREYGVGSDHLLRARLVSGAGELVDTDDDPDLLAALRGGKSGFGIVVELEVALHPITRLYGGGVFLPGEAAPTVLPAWRDWVTTLPEHASSSVALLRLPADPALPPPLQGRFVVHLRFTTTASADDGEALFAPMRDLGRGERSDGGDSVEPIADLVTEMPFAAIDAVHADPTEPMPTWDGSALLGELPDTAIDALLAVAGPGVETPLIMAELRAFGGAITRAPELDSVAGRQAPFGLYALAPMVPPLAGVTPVVVQGVTDAVAPWTVGALPNFLGAAHGGVLPALWDDATATRLAATRRTYGW